VQIKPEDFEIERTEQITRSATVLMLDVSLSMEMRGRFLAAKKVAMALHAAHQLSSSRANFLGMVSFGRVAREVKPERLPEATWDFEWGTKHAARDPARAPDARPPDRPQADHHDHRRANRPLTSSTTANRSSTTRPIRAPSR
jgi:hypothetical protein